MKRGRGRPVRLRTDTECLDYLEKILGFGRARQDIEFWWNGAQLTVSSGPMDEARSVLGAGVDLRLAISHAMATRYRRPKGR